jgi:hypothetical protein
MVGFDIESVAGIRPLGLLWNSSISMPYSPWSISLVLPAKIPSLIDCPPRASTVAPEFFFPAVHGITYLLLFAAGPGPMAAGDSVRLRSALNTTSCASNSFPLPVGPTGSSAQSYTYCTECPDRALSFAGEMAVCPGQVCSALLVTRTLSDVSSPSSTTSIALANQGGVGRPQYVAGDGSVLSWQGTNRRWELQDRAGTSVAARESSWLGSFQLLQSATWDSILSSNASGIRAVVVEQVRLMAIWRMS